MAKPQGRTMLWSLPNANDPLPQASGRKVVLQYRNWFNWAVSGSASGFAKSFDGEAHGAFGSIGVEPVLRSRTIGAAITGLIVICILPIGIGFAVFYLSLLDQIAAPSMSPGDIGARFAVIGIPALLLSAIAVSIAFNQSSQLASAVRSLAAPIDKFSRGELSHFEASQFDEVNDVKQALDKAFRIQFEQNNKAGDDKRAAEQARLLKDEFIGTVSHELRTPLTSISASLSLLVASSESGRADLLEKLLPIALYNSQRLVRLVDDILDIEKLEAGKVKFHLQVLDIGALVERAVDLNSPFADSMAVTLRYQWIEGSLALVDQDRILQVLSNLLSNAIKFSPSGSDVTVTVACREGVVRIAIRDNGPGIADEFKNRIFEKFSQADTSNGRCINGTGLGLSIVKGIVERLGGAVGWSDASGGGSIFFVELPQHKRNLAGVGSVLVCLSDPGAASIICERLTREGF
ncbi:MAG: HAMP domain-containing sensor histidine kinase, partial [Pseudorhodoplanes sp.]